MHHSKNLSWRGKHFYKSHLAKLRKIYRLIVWKMWFLIVQTLLLRLSCDSTFFGVLIWREPWFKRRHVFSSAQHSVHYGPRGCLCLRRVVQSWQPSISIFLSACVQFCHILPLAFMAASLSTDCRESAG